MSYKEILLSNDDDYFYKFCPESVNSDKDSVEHVEIKSNTDSSKMSSKFVEEAIDQSQTNTIKMDLDNQLSSLPCNTSISTVNESNKFDVPKERRKCYRKTDFAKRGGKGRLVTRFLRMKNHPAARKERESNKRPNQMRTTYRSIQEVNITDNNIQMQNRQDVVNDKMNTITFLCERICHYTAAFDKEKEKLKKEKTKLKFQLSVSRRAWKSSENRNKKVTQEQNETNKNVEKMRNEISNLKKELETERRKNQETIAERMTDVAKKLTKDLECSVCTELLVEPAITGCKHAFCSSCILVWLDTKKTCALCKTPVTRLTQSLGLDHFIDNFIDHVLPDQKDSRAALRLRRQKIHDHPRWSQWFVDPNSVNTLLAFPASSTIQRAYSVHRASFSDVVPRRARRVLRNPRRQSEENAQ